MPDAICIRDPFEKAAPQKEVTRIQWQQHLMQIWLPDLGEHFSIKQLNEENGQAAMADGNMLRISPGAYLLTGKNVRQKMRITAIGAIGLKEFVAPKPFDVTPFVVHTPCYVVTAGKSFFISAKIVGIDTTDKVLLEVRNTASQWRIISLQKKTAYDYEAMAPADMVMPGAINYRIVIQRRNNSYYTFPGGYNGNPYAWDYINNNTWQTFVAAANTPL